MLAVVRIQKLKSTFNMGKSSEEKETESRAHKATTDGESKHKHKNKPSFATLGSSPFATNFEATDDEGTQHSLWRDHFRQLCEYKVQFGDCIVPQQYAANPNLGTWVRYQRTQYRDYWEEKPNSVTAEHIRALEGIGFNLGTSKSDFASVWSVRMQQMCEFKAQFGHCVVPYEYSANLKLGSWASTQRRNYKLYREGKSSPMTEERIRELESLGVEWWRSKTDSASIWKGHFQELCEFKAQFGHFVVPIKYSPHAKLGRWVAGQRCKYRLYREEKPSTMTEERIRDLESVGFDWVTSKTDSVCIWSLRFQELLDYKAQSGHCLVPYEYYPNLKLGLWVSEQRCKYKLYREGKPSPMTEKRIRELEIVGFKWEPSKTELASIWSVRFQQLCEFNAQFGHCVVPIEYSAHPKLGSWVSTQRRNYKLYREGKSSPMTEERIRELESLGVEWWRSKTDSASIWIVRLQEMREYKAQFGHCVVPQRYAANLKLGRWVYNQRHNYMLHQEGKPNLMTKERIRDLESVGVEWGTSKTD
jgi:hypothetical protein